MLKGGLNSVDHGHDGGFKVTAGAGNFVLYADAFRRQAEDYYNRYFNVKFMSLRSDYNNCSHTCPNKRKVLLDMERELSDKVRGLLKVSLDNDGYYRADELYQEVELVLEATCTACSAAR